MHTSLNKFFTCLVALLILIATVLGGAIRPVYAASTWANVGTPGFSNGEEWFTSLAVTDGTPYVAYVDWDKGNKATVMKFDGTAWVSVGTPGFSSGNASHTSIALDAGTPYVAYIDGNHYNTATVMKFDGTDWVAVGSESFSPRNLHDLAFTVVDGTPYVAYTSQLDGYKATVMKFDAQSGTWAPVGTSAFSSGEAEDLSLAVQAGTPYVAYSDGHNSGKVTVMKYDSGLTNWVAVGPLGFSAGPANYVSLVIESGTPSVAYEDLANAGKATVMKFDGNTWVPVGGTGVSAGTALETSLTLENGILYLAYQDGMEAGRATVLVYDGTRWNPVGTLGFSNDPITYLSFAVDQGVPYVAYKDLLNAGKSSVMRFFDNTPVVDVSMHSNPKGSYTLAVNATQQSYQSVNDGVVKLASTNQASFLGSEQVIYHVKGADTSFSEMMGLPDKEIDNTYWLPWYNNVQMDTQLRFGNVGNSIATVNVYVGNTLMTPVGITLQPGESLRQSFVGVNNGPVKIESDQNIVASERVIYKVNGDPTSFSEMMALPDHQVGKIYWLPWYNNKELDTQLRVGNASNVVTQVHLSIGGTEMPGSPFTLKSGESKRISIAGINDGPVKIESDENIVASERVIYKASGIPTSFSEMMALPDGQLSSMYWLPSYADSGLDTQLRIGNPGNSTATIHIYAGGAEIPGSPFNLAPGESARQSLPNTMSGTAKIVSNQNIVVSERVIYKVNGTLAGFSELMGLPEQALDSTYWLPWYNNVDIATQLRFSTP